jgi:cytochrome c553
VECDVDFRAQARIWSRNAARQPRCGERKWGGSPILKKQFSATLTTLNATHSKVPIMTTTHRFIALVIASAALSTYGADAASNWKEQCAKCHGDDGKGETKMGKKLSIADLTDPKVQAKFTDEEAFKAMKSGRTDASGKTTMKAIEGLSDDDMKALVPFVRSLKK